jgi:hypothetical protein
VIVCRDWTKSFIDVSWLRLDLYSGFCAVYIAEGVHWYVFNHGGTLDVRKLGRSASTEEAKKDADDAARKLGYVLLTKDEEEKAMLLM